MTKVATTHVELDETAVPATPAAAKVRFYAKADGRMYSKDDAGAEAGPFGAAAGGSAHVIREGGAPLTARTGLNFLAGIVATDDAAGDESEVALDYATTEIVNVAAAEAPGTSDKVPRADHAHAVPNDLITNAMLANVNTQTIKGRTTAAAGDPEDLTATQATAILNAFVGDSGAGGTKGLVPAPAAGDAAAGKYMKADGVWTVPPAGGGGNALLDGSTHTDTLADTVTDGDIIMGNVTSKWSSLAISVPAANVLNVLSVAFGELRASWKALFDGTNPAALGVAAPGTSLIAAHRDHVHLDPVTAHEAAYAHGDIAGHIADAADAHDASAISILDTANDFTATDVEGALAELQADAEAHAAAGDPHAAYALDTDLSTHAGAADPHTGYRLETADHSHASAGAQGGTILLSDTTVSGLTDGQVLKATGAATKAWEDDIAAIEFIIDGGGSAITTGQKGHLEIPFACAIVQVTTLADQTGSIVVDIWKDTYAAFPPTVADTITASAKPTLAAAQKAQDATLTGWTTTVAAGDILAFNVDSITTVTRVVISLKVRKT